MPFTIRASESFHSSPGFVYEAAHLGEPFLRACPSSFSPRPASATVISKEIEKEIKSVAQRHPPFSKEGLRHLRQRTYVTSQSIVSRANRNSSAPQSDRVTSFAVPAPAAQHQRLRRHASRLRDTCKNADRSVAREKHRGGGRLAFRPAIQRV